MLVVQFPASCEFSSSQKSRVASNRESEIISVLFPNFCSFWAHCGDPPSFVCSQRLVVSVEFCDRFMAQDKKLFIAWNTVHRLSFLDCRHKSPKRCRCIRRPTADSFGRPQDIPHWLQPFTEGLVEREAGSSRSAGEKMPTFFLHVSQRDPGTHLEGHTILTLFFEGPRCETCERLKITRGPSRINPESREGRTPRAASGSHSSQRRERIAITPSLCDSSARFVYSMHTEWSVQQQDSTR